MATQNDITLLCVQKIQKPRIEDVIPAYLNGDMKKTALAFATWMHENKMPLKWAGLHNAWKAMCKGKAICYVRLYNDGWSNSEHLKNMYGKHLWVITPYLSNLNSYAETVINENMQNFIWDNVHHCMFCRTPCHGNPPGKDVIVLGKDIKSICIGRQLVWAFDPDEAAMNTLKRLLILEQQALQSP